MGTVYRRGSRLWINYKDAAGKRRQKATGLQVGQEELAQELLDRGESRIAAGSLLGELELGSVTVEQYFEHWIAARRNRGLSTVEDDDTRFRLHALSLLGDLRLEEVRVRHIRSVIQRIIEKGKHAPKTIHHVYRLLRQMFGDAVADEFLRSNPCKLKKQELPELVDKDPEWRATAVFSRSEVESLLSDARIPEHRRILYALLFLTGSRVGEVSALRWRNYERDCAPLGRLTVAWSWNTKKRNQGRVKTKVPREVPVHPLLSKMLAEWRLHGWPALFERAPDNDDLIIPYPPRRFAFNPETHWRSDTCWKRLDADCRVLGIRHRRTHDARRTFISLVRADGGRRSILKLITHGRPKNNIMDVYSEIPWEVLCGEVGKLRIERKEGTVLQMPRAVGSGDGVTAPLHPEPSDRINKKKRMEPAGIECPGTRGLTYPLMPSRAQPTGTIRTRMWKLVPARTRKTRLGAPFQKLQNSSRKTLFPSRSPQPRVPLILQTAASGGTFTGRSVL